MATSPATKEHALSSRTFATATFTVADNASPLVFAFQALRLAVIAEVAGRVGGDRVTVSRPAPGLLILSAHEQEMAAILAELEAAQVFAPLVLDVVAADEQGVEDFAEHLTPGPTAASSAATSTTPRTPTTRVA